MGAMPAFDPMSVEPDTGRPEPFARGVVRFIVTKADPTPAKGANLRSDGLYDRSFLAVEHTVHGGPNDGRKWWNQITLTNTNVQAEEIGARQLSALYRCLGIYVAVTESEFLLGRTGNAEVDIEPESRDPKNGKLYSAKNVTKRYIEDDASSVGVAANVGGGTRGAASAPPAAQAAPKKKPWEK